MTTPILARLHKLSLRVKQNLYSKLKRLIDLNNVLNTFVGISTIELTQQNDLSSCRKQKQFAKV